MKTRTAIFVAVSVALGLASPALFAQGQKPAVTNPSAAKAKQADKNDDMLAGRKGTSTDKKGTAQTGSAQGQQGPGQRKLEAKAQKGSGQGQQGPGQRKAQAMSDPGQGQSGPGSVQSRQKSQMQGQSGLAGGGEQFHKGAASAKGAASSKAAQMHK